MDSALYKELYGEQEKLQKRAYLDHKTLVRDYEFAFRGPEGSRVLEHIMSLCRINSSTFTGNSRTFYNEGVQDVGKAIKRMVMEADPEIYFQVERRVWEEEKQEVKQ